LGAQLLKHAMNWVRAAYSANQNFILKPILAVYAKACNELAGPNNAT